MFAWAGQNSTEFNIGNMAPVVGITGGEDGILSKDKVVSLPDNTKFDEERALYGIKDCEVKGCSFDGPADGESAFKLLTAKAFYQTLNNYLLNLFHL